MERAWYWRLALVVGLLAWAIYQGAATAIYVNAPPEVRRSRAELKKQLPDFLPEARMNLGIDLQGGLHLVMGVDATKAVQARVDRIADELVEAMKEKGKSLAKSERVGEAPLIAIQLEKSEDWDTLRPILDDRRDTFDVRSHSGTKVEFAMKPEYESQLREDAIAQALKTLRNRIDAYGVSEPEVRKRGTDSILIQIAGLTADEEESVKEGILGKTAQLEFKLVDDESTWAQDLQGRLPPEITLELESYRGVADSLVSSRYLAAKDLEVLKGFVQRNPPPSDRTVRYQKLKTASGELWRTWLLGRKTPLTGDSLVSAFVAFNSDENQYYVAIKFDRRGALIFDKLTGENIKKRMAIVLDDQVDSAPVINDRIPNGSASIQLGGYRSQQEILEEAKALSVVLNAGALPAPVYPQEERTVGATIGDSAISKGKLALLVSIAFTLIVMLGYYRLSGTIAVVAMGFNLTVLFAVLSALEATLTLPGIAGLALTVGMAVDANIIQFERIREEIRLGKGVRGAADAGFDKAFSAIFDSNATTLLSAIVLYQYGSGPIRGFATTLGIGVLINTFTAVVVPRLFFDYLTRARRVASISI